MSRELKSLQPAVEWTSRETYEAAVKRAFRTKVWDTVRRMAPCVARSQIKLPPSEICFLFKETALDDLKWLFTRFDQDELLDLFHHYVDYGKHDAQLEALVRRMSSVTARGARQRYDAVRNIRRGWSLHVTPDGRNYYYHHAQTNESRWIKPEEPHAISPLERTLRDACVADYAIAASIATRRDGDHAVGDLVRKLMLELTL